MSALVAVGIAVAMVAAACGGSAHDVSVGSRARSGGAKGTMTFAYTAWGTTWSYNPWNPDALSYLDGMVDLRLAVPKFPSLTKFYPKLATHWSVSGDKVTIQLRRGVNWQNNKPVTSKDVYDTILLDGLNGNALWSDITDVATHGPRQIVFTLRSGEPPALAEYDILTTVIYPSSIYGRFVTKSLLADEVTYYKENDVNTAAAAKLPQAAQMGDVFTKLAALPVKKDLGDGPFKVDHINTQEETLSKWNGFYDASKIHVASLKYLNNTNPNTLYPLLLQGEIDWTNDTLPGPILDKWRTTTNAHLALPLGVGLTFLFNDHLAPLNDQDVRQALAYIIPRKTIIAASYGTGRGVGAVATKIPDGIDPDFEHLYLTKKQLSSLNTYPVNHKKATSLLEAAGYKKEGSEWITPSGKPFTIPLLVPSGSIEPIVLTSTSAAKAMSAFGIKTTVDVVSGTAWITDVEDGNFTMSTETDGGTDPLQFFSELIGPNFNYIPTGQYAGKRGIGFGPTADVPGLGTVEVSQTINKDADTVGPGAKMDQLSYDWARLVNEQLPYLWYGTEITQFSYSTARFTKWPPVNASSTNGLWAIGANFSQREALVQAMEEGYIVPRK